MTVRTIDEIFRDFVIDGVPATGPFNPHKPDIRDTLKALTEGSENFPDNRVIRLNNADEGTANNIVVTASVDIPAAAYQVLYILNVTQENTGPVTVSGAINRALVTNINQAVPAGYLTPGMAVLCIDTGTELRLLSYGDAEAILAAAEDAAARAEAAAAGLNLPVIQPGDAGKSLVVNDDENGYELGTRTLFYNDRASFRGSRIPDGVQYAIIAGYYAPGDDGAANFKLVTSEPNHAGKEQTADGKWWEIVRGAPIPVGCYGVKTDGTDAAGGVSDALSSAGKALLPLGVITLATKLTIDNTIIAGDVQTAGGMVLCGYDARQSVVQSTYTGGTVFDLIFDEGTKAHTQMSFGKFSLYGLNTSDGIKIKNAAFLDWANGYIAGFNIGLTLESVLSSKFSDLRISWNNYGVSAIQGAGFSQPNALTFQQCVFANNYLMGYSGGQSHANVTFLGGSVEGNGEHLNNESGGIFLNFDGSQGNVGANLIGVYFEGNKGFADLKINNTGSEYVTVNLLGCNFTRLDGTQFTQYNIHARGKIKLNLIGVTFNRKGTYVASDFRPYLNKSADVLVSTSGVSWTDDLEAAQLTGLTSGGVFHGSVNSAGAVGDMPSGWTSIRASAGVYRVTHNLGSMRYSVSASAVSSAGVSVERVAKDPNYFEVVTVNSAGTQTDGGFDFIVMAT